jgi:hypothetical protein
VADKKKRLCANGCLTKGGKPKVANNKGGLCTVCAFGQCVAVADSGVRCSIKANATDHLCDLHRYGFCPVDNCGSYSTGARIRGILYCNYHAANGPDATPIRAGKIRNTDHYVYVIAFDRYHQMKVGLSIGAYRPETIAKRNGGKVLALVAVGKHAEARHAERVLLNLLDTLGGLSVSLEATSCADDGHTEWREIVGATNYDVAKVAVLDRLFALAI